MEEEQTNPADPVNDSTQSLVWRLGNSLWAIWAIIGFGFATWISFLYIGLRARNQRWLLYALMWMALTAIAIALHPPTEEGQQPPGWSILTTFAMWGLGMLHTARTLPAWWNWRQKHPRMPLLNSHPSSKSARALPAQHHLSALPGQYGSALPGQYGSALPLPQGGGLLVHPGTGAELSLTSALVYPGDPSAATPKSAAVDTQSGATPRPRPAHPRLAIGSVIPGLGVVDGIPEDGHGSFGTVYRIRREFDEKFVAGKIFRIQGGPLGSVVADRALRDEVMALESLRHVNIVGAMNPVRLGDGSWMLVSEWVDGHTLEAACLGVESLSDDQVFTVGSQLLDALCYLEQEGVVHRDIKPTNVMVDRTGTLKLIDFNLTRMSGRETAVAGTKPYLPPDYIDGFVVDPLVDRYAVGVVLFELVTGKHPYMEYEHAAVPVLPNSIPADPLAFRPDLGTPIAQFLTVAVQPVEASRFADAQQMRSAWVDAHRGEQPTATRLAVSGPNRESEAH